MIFLYPSKKEIQQAFLDLPFSSKRARLYLEDPKLDPPVIHLPASTWGTPIDDDLMYRALKNRENLNESVSWINLRPSNVLSIYSAVFELVQVSRRIAYAGSIRVPEQDSVIFFDDFRNPSVVPLVCALNPCILG